MFKECEVQYKDAGNGSIEGYASTWIRKPDSYGDVVKQGAFEKTLKERWNGGKGIPFLWAHQMDNLKSFIGTAEADEDDHGLHFVATFDDTEEAQKVRQLYKDGRLRKFSFAYDVKDAGTVTLEDGTKANELRELDLFEISAVTVPANDDAGVVDVKSGRRNSKADAEKLEQAITLIRDVLGQLDDTESETEESETEEEASKANEVAVAEEPEMLNSRKDALLERIKNMEVDKNEP
jgi:HK97 family phage prohead protease